MVNLIYRIRNNEFAKTIRILTYVLIGLLFVRLMCYESEIQNDNIFYGLSTSFYNGPVSVITLITIWLQYTSILLVIMRSFFDFRLIRMLSKVVWIPTTILSIIFFKTELSLLQGIKLSSIFSLNGNLVLTFVLMIELSLTAVLGFYYFLKDFNMRFTKKEILIGIGIFLLLMIPTLPEYFCQFLFGKGPFYIHVKGLNFYHRLVIYGALIIPAIMYFVFRNKSEDIKRFVLIYISIGALVGYLVNYNYTNFVTPWDWPFHICNTAMFLVPITLIFKKKDLFYFTLFINVLGAFLATIMTNYDINTGIFEFRMFQFWDNHYIAFFFPFLALSLHLFERPKLKDFVHAMIWFCIYFSIALTFNVVFTAIGHETDYFFINTKNTVVDALGGEHGFVGKVFDISLSFNIKEYTFTFHPVYQVIYFIIYTAVTLAVWFVYGECFRIADAHIDLRNKLKAIKIHEYALQSVSKDGLTLEEKANMEVSLKLDHFSKKYASSKVYAVHDANLEVHEGEVFGFLGPNGAGKSTIIKSMVGIQPITEGHITVCGFDVEAQPVKTKSQIGYVPDHYALYEKLTGREYINYIADIYEVSKEERDERIEKYVKLFELSASIDSPIKTYSHGMKQKITIISALVHDPKIWILDEPLTGLDPNSIYQVKQCMAKHAEEGNIVFFSSHLIDIVEKLCDRIAIIKHGQIQCVKTVKEIEESGVTLEEFYLQIIGDN